MENLPYADMRLILVHAHPDDETINNGATMAKYIALGAQVTLVVCTRGEEGEVLVPALSHLASSQTDALGDHREQELADAMKALGVTDFRFLGMRRGDEGVPKVAKKYRDSGMMGTEQNNRPDVFWQADIEEASDFLLEIIEEIRPHVLITYDEFGGYGHPDHIQAHRVAMKAVEKSNAWQVQKVYWNAIPKSLIASGIEEMKKTGSSFFGAESVDDLPFAKDDALVTTAVDATEYVEQKMSAMKAHQTQISLDGPFFALSNNLGLQVWGQEFYTLVKGSTSGERDANGRETDIFAGIVVQ